MLLSSQLLPVIPAAPLALLWLLLLLLYSGVRPFHLALLLALPLPFLLPGLLPLALSLQLTPELSLSLHRDPRTLTLVLHTLLRSFGGYGALLFLVLTTSVPELIRFLRDMKTPSLMVELMTLTYRIIFILLERLDRIAAAQRARLGYSTFRRSFRSLAVLARSLFVLSREQGERMTTAMNARAIRWEIRFLDRERAVTGKGSLLFLSLFAGFLFLHLLVSQNLK